MNIFGETKDDVIARQATEIARLRAALEKIAACTSHHPDDVVALARLTLGETK